MAGAAYIDAVLTKSSPRSVLSIPRRGSARYEKFRSMGDWGLSCG